MECEAATEINWSGRKVDVKRKRFTSVNPAWHKGQHRGQKMTQTSTNDSNTSKCHRCQTAACPNDVNNDVQAFIASLIFLRSPIQLHRIVLGNLKLWCSCLWIVSLSSFRLVLCLFQFIVSCACALRGCNIVKHLVFGIAFLPTGCSCPLASQRHWWMSIVLLIRFAVC